ncbi:MAG TPA: hypothetical protein VIY73_02150, partial [Polyangiaceae bacterium]
MAADSALLTSWLARAGDPRTAFEDPTGTTTWSAAVEASARVASALLDGRRSLDGERVALLVSPGARFA